MLKSGHLLCNLRATDWRLFRHQSVGNDNRTPSATDPIVRPPCVKEVNGLLTGVLQRPLQLRHRGSGTKLSPKDWVGFTRSPLGEHMFFEGWAAFCVANNTPDQKSGPTSIPESSRPVNARCNVAAHFAIVA
jgi:hypothetical protein